MEEQLDPPTIQESTKPPTESESCVTSNATTLQAGHEGYKDTIEEFTEVAPAIVLATTCTATADESAVNTLKADVAAAQLAIEQQARVQSGIVNLNSPAASDLGGTGVVSTATTSGLESPDVEAPAGTLDYSVNKTSIPVSLQPKTDYENRTDNPSQGVRASGSDDGVPNGSAAVDCSSPVRKDYASTAQADVQPQIKDAAANQEPAGQEHSSKSNESVAKRESAAHEQGNGIPENMPKEGVNDSLLRSRWADYAPADMPMPSAPSMNTSPVTSRDPARPFRNGRTAYNPSYGNINNNGYANGGRPFFDRGDAARLHAQNSKLRQDLEKAQEQIRTMHAKLREEIFKQVHVASQDIIAEVFSKQMDLAKFRASLQQREIELQRRSEQIQQMERFLCVGQSLITSKYPETLLIDPTFTNQERRSMDPTHISRELMREEIANEMNANYRLANARLDARAEALQLHEQKIELLEQNWKTHAEESLREELRGYLEDEISTSIAEAEYKRGFEDGKEEGLAEGSKAAHHDSYLMGYSMARKSFDAVTALRNGLLPFDSPEVSFLFDPTHPENPFNRGMEIGSLGFSGRSSRSASSDLGSSQSLLDGQKEHSQHLFRSGPHVHDIMVKSSGHGFYSSTKVEGPGVAVANPSPAHQNMVKPVHRSRPAFPEPAPEPTLYQQLNGFRPKYNGQEILANGNSGMAGDVSNVSPAQQVADQLQVKPHLNKLTPPDSHRCSNLDTPGISKKDLGEPVPVTNLIDL
ncbi:uncharacterized protein EI97DRAFT_468215 [Westerdykella ornata]|uniref:Uncharacterized protein n=1 Tax=Westerdykella ornata TaxID=318751 RepID=A0A6A6JFU3_WESOR|nr:uncharacterized protein EI97DRAFT_468215 [Westerdykella ornata]KAF2275282.1 hypothetical protein EI97DRAFT_468215 [Westerdykella ornata]